MTPTLAELCTSPDHYLHAFDGDDALFVPMDRAAYLRSIFLDNRINPAAAGSMRVQGRVLAEYKAAALPTGWIFHIAHCGSTLLARGLSELGGNLVLREPLALRQTALQPDAQRLALVLRLLGKRYPGAGPTAVKANVPVNFILPEIAAAQPDAAAIFMFYGWRDYLLAILRSDNHRAWLRNVTGQLSSALGDLSGLPNAERGAALWLAQMRHFAAALAVMPRARSLDAETFFADPVRTLLAAASRLDIATDANRVARIVAGPIFSTYSKNPAAAFANADRIARRAQLEATLAGELDQAGEWLARHGPDVDDLMLTLAKAVLDN